MKTKLFNSSYNVGVFSLILLSSDYIFDPEENANVVTIKFDEIKTQYLRLNFTANTGGTAGQCAEFEAY